MTGQPYSPARYGGMVKYAMWLLRPRVVREFRNPNQTRDSTEKYFMEVVNAVDSLYKNKILEKFWRKGVLVKNDLDQHPYTYNLDEKYKAKDRWFLLRTNFDAKRPWNVNTVIPVFAIAYKLNEPTGQEWLVYCFSPLGDQQNVQIEIPGYKSVEVKSKVEGKFYHITSDGKVNEL